jgi:uncharacterized protein YecT (DUF1311 family)
MRASDADRDAAAEEIREHFAAGRLTQDELDARLSAAYGAQTTEELDHVRADLPALPPSSVRQRAELAARRSELQRELLQQTGGSLAVFVLCAVIWLVSGASGQFWPIWVLIFPALALARNGWRLYGPAPELDRVEADLERRRNREHRRERERRRQLERRR